ncbi:scabin-related ADP-ribosyltransferase [Salmonella enterica]
MKKTIIAFLLFLLTTPSFAVQYVYRVDSRPPDVVFRDGFRPHGYNRNLQQHIRGESCAAGTRNSAFIATTPSIDAVHRIARTYYSSSSFQGTLYAYRIRADNSFYAIMPSASYLSTQGVSFSPLEVEMMRLQDEYVTDRNIPPENIAEAMALNYDPRTSQVSRGVRMINFGFLKVHTESNPSLIPNLSLPQQQNSFQRRINAFGSLITACLSLRGTRWGGQDARGNIIDAMPFHDASAELRNNITHPHDESKRG